MVFLFLSACVAISVLVCVKVTHHRRKATIARFSSIAPTGISVPARTPESSIIAANEDDLTRPEGNQQQVEESPAPGTAEEAASKHSKDAPGGAPGSDDKGQAVHQQVTEPPTPVSGSEEGSDSSSDSEAVPRADGEGRRISERIRHSSERPARIRPADRGGRPRVEAPVPGQESVETRAPHTCGAEIVCWKREQEWILGLEILDGYGSSGISVLQDGKVLPRDEFEESCWRIVNTRSDIVLRDNENNEFSVLLGSDDCLLFKLHGSDLSRGRRIRHVSFGSYLVIVPDSLTRDEELAGPAPAAPEPVCLDGCHAHFFDLYDRHKIKIAFRSHTGRSIVIGTSGPHFQLCGQQIDVANDGMGPLFGVKAPSVGIIGGDWAQVREIVVGEEGSGKEKWRTSFLPIPTLPEQEMPDEILDRKVGWYFARFYDFQDELIDSIDFRFVAGLRAIEVRGVSPLPPIEGHASGIVDIHHERDCHVELFPPRDGDITIRHEAEMTTAAIPASQECDRSCWKVGYVDGPSVPFAVLLDRVWWAFGDEHQSAWNWQDRCLCCSREDFVATSGKVIALRLPRQGWADSVRVGFARKNAREYKIRVNDMILAIPLRDLGDFPEMRTVGAFQLLLRVGQTGQIPLCTLSVRFGCKFDTFSTLSEDELFSHIGTQHLSEFFRSLSYAELRTREPDLPSAIYQCLYNPNHYVKAGGSGSATSAILTHIKENCDDAPRQVPNGQTRYQFRIVDDIDEIREHVIANLPHIQKCQFCDAEFENPNREVLLAHLRREHKSHCSELR